MTARVEPNITLHFDPEPEIAEPLRNALQDFNRSVIGPYRREVVLALARDEAGTFLGGVQGFVIFGWLFVERLWVSEECRGKGLGSSLLRTVERAAAEKGARQVALLSTNWQAPEFYTKQGYETVVSFDLTLDSSGGNQVAVNHLFVKQLDAPSKRVPGR